MGLVEYSDSEGSETEAQATVKAPKPTDKTSKQAFQKLVNVQDSHKIRVNLADTQKDSVSSNDDQDGERPGKRPRLSGPGTGGFNSMLPAPKQNGAAPSTSQKKLEMGVTQTPLILKTAGTPGFVREPLNQAVPALEGSNGHDNRLALGEGDANAPQDGESDSVPLPAYLSAPEEPKKVGNPMMFRPLSVARKPQKPKPKSTILPPSENLSATAKGKSAIPSKPPAKISLFSLDEPSAMQSDSAVEDNQAEYQPFLSESAAQDGSGAQLESREASSSAGEPLENPVQPAAGQSLKSLASDLNLTASQRRQLFGRHGSNKDAAVLNFNADAEYNANEAARTAAEGDTKQQAQNPVRAIAPGKHSLKQLVNAVAGQREALEESFATGKRNRKEAGSKYGW